MQECQDNAPLAVILGEPMTALPHDLFIPPEALEVFLESFEGPLDLLLYLIRKQKLDVVDLPIHAITQQYLDYVAYLQGRKVELAADYLVMAATLAEIKSRLLLPRPALTEEEEEDPRLHLIRQLKAYEVIKQAQEQLDELPRLERDFFQAKVVTADDVKPVLLPPQVSLTELTTAFSAILKRAAMHEHHHVIREALSIRERMTHILAQLKGQAHLPFTALFSLNEGRAGVVVTLLALLELNKEQLVELVQTDPFSLIHVKAY